MPPPPAFVFRGDSCTRAQSLPYRWCILGRRLDLTLLLSMWSSHRNCDRLPMQNKFDGENTHTTYSPVEVTQRTTVPTLTHGNRLVAGSGLVASSEQLTATPAAHRQ